MNYKNQYINILILACKRGDQKAQMELYHRFNQSLYYSAYRIVKNADDALDALITGSGDVVCKGNPKKQKTKITGSGDISVRD